MVIAAIMTIAAVTIIFFIFRILPGTPFTSLLINPDLGSEEIAELEALYGLNEPLHIQYLTYLQSLLLLDFGVSLRSGEPVWDVILPKLRNSLILFGPAFVFTAIISSLFGMYIGWNRGSKLEEISIILTTAIRGAPSFITGIFLLLIFSYWLGLTPIFGMISPERTATGWREIYLTTDYLHHAILPFLTTALYFSGDFVLLARNGVVEKKGEEFLKLHKAKGLTEMEQWLRAGRNSLLPLVTFFALRFAFLFQGLIVLEIVFAWPGFGRELVIAVNNHDFTFVQAAVFLIALAVILANLAADLIYGYLDPTVEVTSSA